MRSIESNKAKIANRVIEVFDFFDENHTEATVMDIVRRYGRPQSSTSELLSSLVNLGLLYKDPQTRSYSPTWRCQAFIPAKPPRRLRPPWMARWPNTTRPRPRPAASLPARTPGRGAGSS